MLPFDIAPFECAWKGREGARSSREENKAIEFWSPTRNSWSVTINAKCCTWHTLRGHVILPTPQLLLLLLPVLLLDGSRETTTSPPGWGAQYEQKKEKEKKCRHALRDFCWRRLRWLYTSIFVVVSYVYIEAKMCGTTCGVFPHLWQASKNKHQLQAGSPLLLLSLCPKCHFLVSNTLSCQFVVCQATMPPPKSNLSSKAEEGVAVAIETTSSSTTSSLQSSLRLPHKPSHPHTTPHHTHTHPPLHSHTHTPPHTMCFFCFHLLFFSFFNSIIHLWRFLQFSG